MVSGSPTGTSTEFEAECLGARPRDSSLVVFRWPLEPSMPPRIASASSSPRIPAGSGRDRSPARRRSPLPSASARRVRRAIGRRRTVDPCHDPALAEIADRGPGDLALRERTRGPGSIASTGVGVASRAIRRAPRANIRTLLRGPRERAGECESFGWRRGSIPTRRAGEGITCTR